MSWVHKFANDLVTIQMYDENESRIEWVGKVEVEVQALKAESYLY